jgi:hypothetical protein
MNLLIKYNLKTEKGFLIVEDSMIPLDKNESIAILVLIKSILERDSIAKEIDANASLEKKV